MKIAIVSDSEGKGRGVEMSVGKYGRKLWLFAMQAALKSIPAPMPHVVVIEASIHSAQLGVSVSG